MYIEYFIKYTLNKISLNKSRDIEKEKSKSIEKNIEKIEVSEETKEKINVELKAEGREEQIKKSLENMTNTVNDDYERSKIIDKIKTGKQNSDKVR